MADKEDDKYDVLEKIGQGSFGIIRKVRVKSTGQILCRKEISYSRMSERERTQLHAELRILESLRHPNIVQYCHREHLKSSHDLYLYMEYCGNGDLGGYVKKLKERNQYAEEEFIWTIFAQLVSALYRCHYGEAPPQVGDEGKVAKGKQPFQSKEGHRMILHRDLKPENVFLGDNNSVKLGDFGLSKIIASHDFASTYVGTPFYMSPEICAAERYSHHSDIWSLGCIIYELASRCVPFDARSHVELIMKIKAGRIRPLPTQYSKELGDVIGWCLKVDPRSRPDTAQLLNIPNIQLVRTRLQHLEERQSTLPLQQERDAALAKLSQAQAQIQELKQEVQRLREAGKKVEMEWHARATLAIDQRVHEQVEAKKGDLLKQFELAVEQRAEEKLALHLASLPSSHGLVSGDSTHVRSCTPPPGKAASFATTGTTGFSTDGSSHPSGLDDSALDTDLTSLSIQEELEDVSPLAQRTKPLKKTSRKPLGRAKTYANCNLDIGAIESPMDVHMADPSPMRAQAAPMSIKGLSLSPRKNGQERLSGAVNLRRNIFHREQQLRPTLPGESHGPVYDNGDATFADDFADGDLLDYDEDIDANSVGDSPSRPTSGLSSRSNPTNGDPFKIHTLSSKPKLLSRPPVSRQKTMPVTSQFNGQLQSRANVLNGLSRPKSPVREKENQPPNNAILNVTASPTRSKKNLTPSRRAPPPPAPTAVSSSRPSTAHTNNNTMKSFSRPQNPPTPGKPQGRTLVQLQQARSHPTLVPTDHFAQDSYNNNNTAATSDPIALDIPSAPRLLPSPAKWDPFVEGDEMPSPFLAKKFNPGTLPRTLVR